MSHVLSWVLDIGCFIRHALKSCFDEEICFHFTSTNSFVFRLSDKGKIYKKTGFLYA